MSIAHPTVPQEVEHLLDDRVLEVHSKFAAMEYDKLLEVTEKTSYGSLEKDSSRYGAIMIGRPGADPEAGVSVYASSYQQAWKPSKAVASLFFHDVVNPDGVTLILPNNSGSQAYYEFSDAELETMEAGDLRPMYEKQMRTVERYIGKGAIGDVSLSGFSQGGLMALGMASVDSSLPIKKVRSFEAPSAERTPKKLKSDFTKSGGPVDQLRAIKDAAIPALSKSLRFDRLAGDYIRFGLDSTRRESKAIMNAMASPNVDELVTEALARNDDLDLIIGYIAGSRMKGDVELPEAIKSKVVQIAEGKGSHRHATSDNIVANALFMNL